MNTNYDESKIAPYPLPELLLKTDGRPVQTADAWTNQRRPEILALFQQHVYGKTPATWGPVAFATKDVKTDALNGKATRKIIHISLPDYPAWQGMDLMLYLPNGPAKPAPCFVGASFMPNHAVTSELDLPLSSRSGSQDEQTPRGAESTRWPLDMIISHGFALATYHYGDIEPDSTDGWKHGVRATLSNDGPHTTWKNGDWGAIGAWAWGLSRIADYLHTDLRINAHQLAVIGHSRLGKTALWAGAQDPRFALVISNNSGEGGAALMRRNFGETTATITQAFPHWFTPTYSSYANNESACPVDQHMLIALAAPRPIYIASAAEDLWADPKGEFLSGLHAQRVYALFGKQGYGVTEQPPLDTPVGDTIAYHIRTGKHDLTRYDWELYLKFARRHLAS